MNEIAVDYDLYFDVLNMRCNSNTVEGVVISIAGLDIDFLQ